MRGLFNDELGPFIRARGGEASRPILTRTVRTTGIAESTLADLLVPHRSALAGLSLAYLPGQEGVDLRLTSRGRDRDDAARAFDAGEAVLREAAGAHAYGVDDEDLAAVVLGQCREAGLQIAVGESCTGGMLGQRLTAVPGSSDVFVGGAITYDNRIKISALGVDASIIAQHGAVSKQVAIAMARGACERFGTAIGIGITGVAGPAGGTVQKPVGLVHVAVQVDGQLSVRGGQLIGDRAEVRFRATQLALDLVRRSLELRHQG
jgi:nicotinamide-nucleotide amidase